MNSDVADALSIKPFEFTKGLREGQPASITCTTSNHNVQFAWMKNGQTLRESKPAITIVTLTTMSVLAFDKVRASDNGNYSCVATNGDERDSYTAELMIASPPQWLIEPHNALVVRNEGTVLNCAANGTPAVKIEWTVDGEKGTLNSIPFLALTLDSRCRFIQ